MSHQINVHFNVKNALHRDCKCQAVRSLHVGVVTIMVILYTRALERGNTRWLDNVVQPYCIDWNKSTKPK